MQLLDTSSGNSCRGNAESSALLCFCFRRWAKVKCHKSRGGRETLCDQLLESTFGNFTNIPKGGGGFWWLKPFSHRNCWDGIGLWHVITLKVFTTVYSSCTEHTFSTAVLLKRGSDPSVVGAFQTPRSGITPCSGQMQHQTIKIIYSNLLVDCVSIWTKGCHQCFSSLWIHLSVSHGCGRIRLFFLTVFSSPDVLGVALLYTEVC